jgi:hypothetical protein
LLRIVVRAMLSSMIRSAVADDVGSIREVERAAGEMFREIGMSPVADADLPSVAVVGSCIARGGAWVVDDGAGVVAFVMASVLDESAHIDQVSVHPKRRGQRLGAA